ncbi:MAG TPA: hypothetical protein VG870_11000 [Chitinophagaceae bacterium]|nr:hypothetical protein [Chitinophagaceae bacterium]
MSWVKQKDATWLIEGFNQLPFKVRLNWLEVHYPQYALWRELGMLPVASMDPHDMCIVWRDVDGVVFEIQAMTHDDFLCQYDRVIMATEAVRNKN